MSTGKALAYTGIDIKAPAELNMKGIPSMLNSQTC